MLFSRKDDTTTTTTATFRERATVALASLQRNAFAMSMLRGRMESRINFILNKSNGGRGGGDYQDMTRVLELVKNSELILNELSVKVESARFLEEFITIIDSAASSVSGIKGDVENLVPIAENALLEMHDAIAKISGGLYGERGQAEEQKIMNEAAAAVVVVVPAAEVAAPVTKIGRVSPPAAITIPEAIEARKEKEEKERQAELA